jgi:hypothetical protein
MKNVDSTFCLKNVVAFKKDVPTFFLFNSYGRGSGKIKNR